MLGQVLAGIGSGILTAILGYFKSSGEVFDTKKALQTVVIGGTVGGIAGLYGWSYQEAYQWASTVGIITLVEYIKKGILRRLGKEL